eukprot:TRINITY_DN3390_c0_g1_i1.p1 TRINITY_DN3390_c0_g1~~TRINITY_DN3390_c0_g1_i1.p1  ORF type:complete len:189 (+),score=13.40 TRINITY_DN3390_c0_g1_i1:237-803(+)
MIAMSARTDRTLSPSCPLPAGPVPVRAPTRAYPACSSPEPGERIKRPRTQQHVLYDQEQVAPVQASCETSTAPLKPPSSKRRRVEVSDILAVLKGKVDPEQWHAMSLVVHRAIIDGMTQGASATLKRELLSNLRRIVGVDRWNAVYRELKASPPPDLAPAPAPPEELKKKTIEILPPGDVSGQGVAPL